LAQISWASAYSSNSIDALSIANVINVAELLNWRVQKLILKP